MSDSPTPETLSTQAENDLICEKLLGLKKHCDEAGCPDWVDPTTGDRHWRNYTFTTWAQAGLILDALTKASIGFSSTPSVYAADKMIMDLGTRLQRRLLGPPCIRAAALEYIRSLP